jgi:hypothetical protein
MGMTRTSRAALAFACIGASLATGSSTAAGAVVIGQTGPVTGLCSQDQDWAQQVVSEGNVYIVP